MYQISSTKRNSIKNFHIVHKEEEKQQKITHKKIVRYLGVHIDELLRLNTHLSIQLQKANKSFKRLSRLFYNKNIEKRAKVILYMLLTRPIITYACPIWWNISASKMEKLRRFERTCLRATLNMYRSPNSNFMRKYSNKNLYETANIPRIDLFILKLTRNYLKDLPSIPNKIINSFATTPFFRSKIESGYFPPQYFMHLDHKGLIQNEKNIPIIYHLPRHQNNKFINYSYENTNDCTLFKYNTSLSRRDRACNQRINKKYFWIKNNSKNLDEIRRRSKKK